MEKQEKLEKKTVRVFMEFDLPIVSVVGDEADSKEQANMELNNIARDMQRNYGCDNFAASLQRPIRINYARSTNA